MHDIGVAVDIGTTTLVVSLLDINTSELVGDDARQLKYISSASGVNAQRFYGADVITRINYCAKKGHEKLTDLIREQVAELIKQAIEKYSDESGLNRGDLHIRQITITGNTIMQHLAAGYSPVSMGTAPFTTYSLFGNKTSVWEELKGIASRDAKIYYAPAISAYVGGDVTTGLLAVERKLDILTTNPDVKTYLLIDIGTNGEMVLKHNGKYYCCATAAGPAFEGAHIKKGMAAISGAISHVVWNENANELKLKVIGDTKPIGLCGSGLLDTLAYLVNCGKVDETGRLDAEKFYLTDNVYITSEDVRKLQLAKAAIAAGGQTLLKYVGITEEQVELLVLAGNFGTYLDKNSAAKIGLIPKNLVRVTHALGNTALEGAALTISQQGSYEKLEEIRKKCQHVELSTSNVFNEQFIEQMMF